MAKTSNSEDGVPEPFLSLMNEAGYSINSLADETGIPFSTLRRRLRNPDSITLGETLALAEALHETPTGLIEAINTAEASAA